MADSGNRLLAALPHHEYERLATWLQPVTLKQGTILWHTGQLMPRVYFPTTAIISSVTLTEQGGSVEGLLAGNEGAAGVAAAFELPRSPWRVVVQVSGTALAIEAAAAIPLFEELPRLRRLLTRYSYATQQLATQSIACNRFHSIHERLARWLLMLLDRIDGDTIEITHEFLAQMLGTYRPSVTHALTRLVELGYVVREGRGKIRIEDRDGLEDLTCECYRRVDSYLHEVFAPD